MLAHGVGEESKRGSKGKGEEMTQEERQGRKGEGRGGGHMSSIFRFFCSDILRPIFRILVKAK